jgi:hypothetical protein
MISGAAADRECFNAAGAGSIRIGQTYADGVAARHCKR